MTFGVVSNAAEGDVTFKLSLKTCRICGMNKPISEFHLRSDSKRHRNECNSCKSYDHKVYYREKYSEIAKLKSKKFRESDQRVALLASCKASARKKNLYFDLTIDDIVIPEFCPYLHIRLTNIQGVGRVYSNASVDRIDPSKGYVKGNIQILSFKANTMKQNASLEELRLFCENVLKHIGEQK